MNKLMLMSGSTVREGWKRLDAKGGDYQATIPPLPDEVLLHNWDEIELIHGINLLYPWNAVKLLCQIANCLSPGGVLVLEQPNFDSLCDARKQGWIFGDPVPRDPEHMAKWAYRPSELGALVLRCGFRRWKLLPAEYHIPGRDFRIEARV